MTDAPIPKTQHAVQLIGPDRLALNTEKVVFEPGPHQILCRVEAVGLCFSDLKLLKQFADHPRKGVTASGVDPKVLKEIPSYVPAEKPTVPGHETVVTVVAAGPGTKHQVGERALVQTDYRWLPTDRGSNSSFGYNFEGGLQEFVLMDERIITTPAGESMLIPVGKDLSASAVALVEPWACVENAYVSPERQRSLGDGRLLVVVDEGRDAEGVAATYAEGETPTEATAVMACRDPGIVSDLGWGEPPQRLPSLDHVGEAAFNDIIYFGSDARTIERLDRMLAPRGLLNVVLGGKRIGEKVSLGFGRCHYGGMRYIGTTGSNAAESLGVIPETPEIRPYDRLLIVGAAGPMGLMHVVRALCQGVVGIEVIATDLDDGRRERLDAVAGVLAQERGLSYRSLNPEKNPEPVRATYTVLMAPAAELVAEAVEDSLEGGIINIFAGIPATVSHEIDLDAYIEKRLYFIGTSGSVLSDMRIVLDKLTSGRLDTNLSVGAVCGMRGAIDGIRAVESRAASGKIIVYPMLHHLGLMPLDAIGARLPAVSRKMDGGKWTREAEAELLSGSLNSA
jgi:threonine dehydrogenase-like Zn-dependent dehydrogenase